MQLAAVAPPPIPASSRTTLQEISYQSHEKLDIAYQDSSGRAFNLSIERDISYYSATYDRGGNLGTRPDSLKKDLKELESSLRGTDGAVKGFQHLLHRLLKAVDKEYGDWFSGGRVPAGSPQQHADVLASSESVTVSMTVVDPAYWSVDKTAGRLKDFALSLFGGGDRQAHVDKMEKAMEEGYRQAADAFGGKLPEIARQTVDAAKKMLSDWVEAAKKDALPPEPTQQLDLVA